MRHGFRALLIAGPTASGKSGIALELAERLDGVVINADAIQVYRDVPILTARPTPVEEARAPHRLYGYLDGRRASSVGLWLEAAACEIRRAEEQGRLPIFVGGTGLYLNSLTEGLVSVPPIPEPVRAEVRARMAAQSASELHAELAAKDPAAAHGLRPSDTQRIARALEVFVATGRSLRDWQADRSPQLLDEASCLKLVIMLPAHERAERIAARFQAMIEAGVLGEVETLLARRLAPDLPVMKALGLRQLGAHLRGEMSLADAIERACAETRRYAKRQGTWLRGRMADWIWSRPEEAAALLLDRLAAKIALRL